MKQPIWIRERRPAEPPPLSLQPVFTFRKRGAKQTGEARTFIGWLPYLLIQGAGKRNPTPLEIVLMRYRLLILLFSVSNLKT